MRKPLRLLFSVLVYLGCALPGTVFGLPIWSQLFPVPASYESEVLDNVGELMVLANEYCTNIYPRPATGKECIDKLKVAIGNGFDVHTEFFNKKAFQTFREATQNGGWGGIGIEIKKVPGPGGPILIVSPLEGGPAERVGLRADDIIESVTVGGIEYSTRQMKTADEFVALVRGELGITITLKVKRVEVDAELVFPVKREKIKLVNVSGELIKGVNGKTYAAIVVRRFSDDTTLDLKTKYKELASASKEKLAGLILVGEDNLGGLLDEAHGVADLFMEQPSYVFVRSNDRPMPVAPKDKKFWTKGDITNGIPILMVVNAGCASACEIVAGSLQLNNRVAIAGVDEYTYGKGLVQNVRQINDFEAMKWTMGEYYIGTIDGGKSMPIQCIGVKVDIVFQYGSIKYPKRFRECDFGDPVRSNGPMPNAIAPRPMSEANPEHYKAGLEMLEAWKTHVLPKKLAAEAMRAKLLEAAKTGGSR